MGPSTGMAEKFLFMMACLLGGVVALLLGFHRTAIVVSCVGAGWFLLSYLVASHAQRGGRRTDEKRKCQRTSAGDGAASAAPEQGRWRGTP